MAHAQNARAALRALASLDVFCNRGAYIRSSELSSIVEGAHSNDARTAKGWLEHELRHAAETREA